MYRKTMVAFVALMMVAMACFLVSPAFSGEHPWDSDKDDGGDGGKGDPLYIADTIPDSSDTTVQYDMFVGGSSGTSLWSSMLTGAWSSILLM